MTLTLPQETTDWNAILDTENVFKLYYCLQIIDGLLYSNNKNNSQQTAEEVEEKRLYREKFLNLGGLKHLFKIFLNIDFFTAQNDDSVTTKGKGGASKKIECLSLVLRLICVLVHGDSSFEKGTS